MKKWTDIDEIKIGDTVIRSNGLKAKPSPVFVRKINVTGNYATMSWSLSENSDFYYSTNFRKSENIADFGLWHDLTTQQWSSK